MTLTQTSEGKVRLRVWPGVVAVILQWFLWVGLPLIKPEAIMVSVMGGFIGGGLAVLVWWALFSRAPHVERWGALVLIIGAVAGTRRILDPSIAGAGMGMLFYAYVVPVLCLALVGWAVACGGLARGARRWTLVAAILAACGVFACLRTEGVTGGFHSQFAWRWAKTSEQKLLERAGAEAAAPASTVATARTGADWPGFRGLHRDAIVSGLRIKTDWRSSPPVELWRRAVGPGWSSIAVGGGLLYTQEQRGEFEVVACYEAATGKPVWTHRDAVRFFESNGGAGPRGTPTVHDGRVYALGATGILNALDAGNGAVEWTRNAATDTGAKLPGWAFSSSPLVVGDLVIVAASGRLAAYDRATGAPRWRGPDGGESYASPQLLTIGGVEQVLLLDAAGLISVAPADGKVLWKHAWTGGGFASLQPAPTADGDVLIANANAGGGIGVRRLAVTQGPGGWSAKEVWTSPGLKPYFNDLAIHNGYAYGFDGGILSCIDLRDGKRMWKGGRYGYGQMVLLSDQGLLLVTSEEGEVALVAAAPGQFTELARIPAVEGKTWNHPAVAGDILLVRNGREMVAFRLPLAGG
ncbi:MAG: PQQ-binding-like beta-propeller repeat protein [Bryobacteraceae bacterium]